MSNLVFIYQANSGILANIPGAIAKAFGGKSMCSLCNITNGPIREKPEWETFVTSLQEKPEIYHADEIPDEIQSYLTKNRHDIPVVLERNGSEFTVAASSADLDACQADPACLAKKLASYTRASCNNGVCSLKQSN